MENSHGGKGAEALHGGASSQPLLSIIVPAYNMEVFLERCMDSVLGQTFSDFEVIVVDDGSTDGTPALCDAYADRDSRVRVVHKSNGGIGSARNAGLRVARGAWLMFLDADDWLAPDALRSLVDAQAASGADVVAGKIARVDAQGEVIELVHEQKAGLISGAKAVWMCLVRRWLNDYCVAKIFRRSLIAVDFFPEGMFMEDHASVHAIYSGAQRVQFIPQVVYSYFVQNSVSVTNCAVRKPEVDMDFLKAIVMRYDYAMASPQLSGGQKAEFRMKTVNRMDRWMVGIYEGLQDGSVPKEKAVELDGYLRRLGEIAGREVGYEDLGGLRKQMFWPRLVAKVRLYVLPWL